jgi:hypothetical protein
MNVKTLLVHVCVVVLLFGACRTRAQSCINYQPNYSFYSDISSDGTSVFTSALVEGTSSMTLNTWIPGCNMINIGNAVHTPIAVNVISANDGSGYVGGQLTGNAGCPSCYISVQNNQSIVPIQDKEYSYTSVGEVICNMGGPVYEASLAGGIGWGISTLKYSTVQNQQCTYTLNCPNGNQNTSCPSGPLVTSVPCPHDYFVTDFLVVKKAGRNQCFGIGPGAFTDTPSNCK